MVWTSIEEEDLERGRVWEPCEVRKRREGRGREGEESAGVFV